MSNKDFQVTNLKHVGMWHIPSHGRAICPDGIIRCFRITGQADTFFSIPAQVRYKGKTVTGFITTCHTIAGKKRITSGWKNYEGDYTDIWDEYEFCPNKFGKNGNLFPADEVETILANAHRKETGKA